MGHQVDRIDGARLIVVEDDESIRELLSAGLRFAQYDVITASDGLEALQAAATSEPDLIVLDVNLPGIDGFEVCRRLRADGLDVPVIFLTARGDLDDLRTGYSRGGDDYVTKPFSLDELTFRIEAVLRRAGRGAVGDGQRTRLACGHVELDESTYQVWSAGSEISLTPTEFRLLRYLLVNVDLVLTRLQILEHVWSPDFEGDWRIIEPYVSNLRKKLHLPDQPGIIVTVRQVGYSARRPVIT